MDPYFDANIFSRYVANVRLEVPVTLVASEPDTHAGKSSRDRWAAFLDVSRLYAEERGAQLYRLLVQPKLHDRWVVFDEKRIYSLGGSIKDVGRQDDFTITSVDASPENVSRIRKNIDSGIEYFGPSTAVHL